MNPHFLYNTLELIRYCSISNQVDMVNKLIQMISTFYKKGLNNGKTFYTVADEIKLENAYIGIMSLRYYEQLHFIIDIDENINDYYIPTLTLQPIVENAITHGILMTESRKGVVVITGKRDENKLIFTVEDDGIGMDPMVMDEINNKTFHYQEIESGHQGSHIGVRNVIERIELLFGSEYGITFSSVDAGGTIATVVIPIIVDKED